MGEVGQAVARQNLNLEEANTLIKKLINKYEHVFDLPEGNPGGCFNQAYDPETIKPTHEWQSMYEAVKDEVRAMGLLALNSP
jgi:methylamine--corrinoid protein Co-methyltransferase